jgi:PAS domain S-box-containing protein
MTVPFDARDSARLVFLQSRQATILVAADGPTWTILDVNLAYLAVTRRERADLVGRPLFDAFPESLETTQAHGSHQVAASLEQAMGGLRVVLPVQRYDLPSRDGAPGAFEAHYWEMSTAPLRDDRGALIALVHDVTNVTDRELALRERQRLAAQLETQHAMLQTQAAALEQTNWVLQDNAIELEAQAEELQATAAQLEERTEEAESARQIAEVAERQLQTVFAQAPAAVGVTVGASHTFVLANRGYEQLVGRPVPAGRTFREVLPDLVEQGYLTLLDQVYATGTPYVAREAFVMVDKGGPELEEGWYDFVYQPLVDAEGRVNGLLQQAVDVTARVRAETRLRENEAQLRTLVDAIPTLAWTAGPDGYIDWYNKQWYTYTGTTAAQMEGWGWQDVHHPDALPRVLEQWNRSIATSEPFEMTFPLRGADGEYRQFLSRVAPLRNSEGTVVRWFGTNTDVEFEHAARRAAEDANAAKTTFLATMSHELRTPLNALGGYLELLLMELRGPLTGEQRNDLERMQRSQHHLMRLINDVLHFAKIDTGHAEFTIEPVDVGDVLRRVEELVSPQCANKGIICSLAIPAPSPIARTDGERVGQILLNLLSNAAKYTPAGGRITATCERDGEEVSIRIADTGDGIPSALLESIFDPFVQVGRRLNAPRDGVGLGLAISRALAEGLRGTLSVESEVGAGSTFTLRVPAEP